MEPLTAQELMAIGPIGIALWVAWKIADKLAGVGMALAREMASFNTKADIILARLDDLLDSRGPAPAPSPRRAKGEVPP